MRQIVVLTVSAAIFATGCGFGRRGSTPPRPVAQEIRTVQNVGAQTAALEPPPMLLDEMPPPKPKVQPWEKPTPIILSPEDEKLRSSLPFSPAIAMDPIDGSKISIRAATPTHEYKGKIYYFSSEANRQMFIASPDQYLTGRFTAL